MQNPLSNLLLSSKLFSVLNVKGRDILNTFNTRVNCFFGQHFNISKKKQILLLFTLFTVTGYAETHTYYVRPLGDDSKNGLSVATAWKTIARVSSFNFEPGDKILFEGGQIFKGNLKFQAGDGPLVVASYGEGKAIINADKGSGIYALNVGGIEIHNLIIKGNGASNNNGNGIFFYMNKAIDLSNIIIDSTEVYGFGSCGIVLGATGTSSGYKNVKIINNVAHDNGKVGIITYGDGDLYNHRKFYVAFNKTYNNLGRTDITNNNTGNGIVVSGVDGFKVEHCEAYGNGANNRNNGGGPVGIWCYNAKNGVIQYCESHHNKAGLYADGGGFDIDGGSQNCVVQYNYSHDNEGSGFALFEYGSSNKFTNDTIRYNISENDGLKNGYGALGLWASGSANKISNSQIYNNVFYADNFLVGAAINIFNSNISNVKVFNNIFYCKGVPILKGNSSTVTWQNNDYYSTGTANFTVGGSTVNPQFVAPGTGVKGYKLSAASPMIDKGLFQGAVKDFFGNAVPRGITADIGVYEASWAVVESVVASSDDGNVPKNTIDEKLNTRWSANGNNQWIRYRLDTTASINDVKIAWYRGNERKYFFDIQASTDGRSWTTLLSTKSSGETTAMESYDVQSQLVRYIRIVGHGNTNNSWNAITEVKFMKAAGSTKMFEENLRGLLDSDQESLPVEKRSLPITENSNDLKIWPNPAAQIVNLKTSEAWVGGELIITDLSGRIVLERKFVQPIIQLNFAKEAKGVYVLKLSKDGKVLNRKIVLQ